MKLSLWQQFSSNHSGAYTVVGAFATPDEAQNARAILQRMMQEIDASNRQSRPDTWRPNAVEEQYEKMFTIDWQEPIDWLSPFATHAFRIPFQRQIDEHVTSFDRIVFIDAPSTLTWQTGHQFSDLMRAMGAQTYAAVYDGTSPDGDPVFTNINFRLDCIAPSEFVAEEVYNVLVFHLENRSLTPWDIYHPRFNYLIQSSTLSKEQVQAAYDALKLWHYLNTLIIGYEHGQQASWSMQAQHPILDIIEEIRREVSLQDGTLIHTGHHVTFQERKGGTNLIYALPALGVWLQNKGCLVTYEFEQDE